MSNWRAFVAALSIFAASIAGAKPALEKIVRNAYPVPPNVSISVHLSAGTVHVYGAKENVIQLTAIGKAYTPERLDKIKVDVKIDGDSASIETTLPPKPSGLSFADRSGTVDYVLLVPQTCTIREITVDDGEVVVDGLRGGGVNVRLTNGRILAMNCFAPTGLTLGRGGMDVFYYWWEDRPITLNAQSTAGDINVSLPPDSSVIFDAATQHGWIRNQFAGEENGSGDSQQLHWTLGANPSGEFGMHTADGNIRIGRVY